MTFVIGGNRNVNDTASIPAGITLNATTSVKIADANEDRMFFRVDNDSNMNDVWVKLQAASVDDDQKGIFLQDFPTGTVTAWEMPPDNIYTGEISAIADSGNPEVFVTEY